MTKRALLLSALVLTAALVNVLLSCTRDAQHVQTVGSVNNSNKTDGSVAGQPVGDSGSVRILPDVPTSSDDLQAIHGPTGRAVYRWARNNYPIEGEISATLKKDRFRRGDVVTLTAVIDGIEKTTSAMIRNSPPQVISVIMSPEQIYRGVDITAHAKTFDEDGDNVRLSYKWNVNGKEIQGDSNILRGDQFKRADTVNITVTPSDNDGSGSPFTSRDFIIPNAPPQITSTPVAEFTGNTYIYQVIASDPDGDPITYALSSAPSGMTIDAASGKITWNIARDQAGEYVIEIIASDRPGSSSAQKYPLKITMQER